MCILEALLYLAGSLAIGGILGFLLVQFGVKPHVEKQLNDEAEKFKNDMENLRKNETNTK